MGIEKVITAFRSLGFDPEVTESGSYLVKYDGIDVLYLPDEDDEEFFRIVIPGVFDVTDENREMVMELVNKTNVRLKYTKTCIMDDAVWVVYEAFILDEALIEGLIEHGMCLLKVTAYVFHKTIEGDDRYVDKVEEQNEDNDE
jgi:hypothetical protein